MATIVVLAASFAFGQQSPTSEPKPAEPKPANRLENTGKPMKVAGVCTEDDIQSLGMACTADEPCPIYLELSAIETIGPKLFLTGNLHTESVTLSSILLVSEDNGKTWNEAHERIKFAGLEAIQFFDFEAGWISGQLLATIPRDPFVLVTTDGGKSWRKRSLFVEPRPGTIDTFWFDSRNSGGAIVDRVRTSETGTRWELVETETGGESWSIREVSSKPIKPRKTKPINTDWRLRTDAPSKSWRLEKKLGEKWQNIAAFQIGAGECRAAELKLLAPPSEEEQQKQEIGPTAPGGVFVVPSGPRKKKP